MPRPPPPKRKRRAEVSSPRRRSRFQPCPSSEPGLAARPFFLLLALEAQRRVRDRLQPLLRDRLRALLADPERAFLDPLHRVLDRAELLLLVLDQAEREVLLERVASHVRH